MVEPRNKGPLNIGKSQNRGGWGYSVQNQFSVSEQIAKSVCEGLSSEGGQLKNF